MPGLDRIQDQLISSTLIKEALRDYRLVPSQMLIDQQALLAANLAQQKKQPSVFYAGTWLDAVASYTPSSAGNAAKWLARAGVTTVKVLSIQDANTVTLRFWQQAAAASLAPVVLLYMLSVNNPSTPVPLDQVSFVGGNQTISSTTGGNDFAFQYLGDTIPCAGYKYIHLLGFQAAAIGGNDMWTLFQNPPPSGDPVGYNGLTYALVK